MKYLHLLWQLILLQLVLLSACFANEKEKAAFAGEVKDVTSKLSNISDKKVLSVNQSLLDLLAQLKQENISKRAVTQELAKVTLLKQSFNDAEQYLLLIAKALLKEKYLVINSGSEDIVSLLKEADELSDNISKQQLSQPEFLQLHLILAKHYAKLEKFDLAYQEKKSYLNKYYIYRKNKRLKMIASLEQSYEVENKKQSNSLLESANKQKVRRVVEVQKERDEQQYNFSIIIAVVITFVLLFFRQLRLRNKLIRLTRTDSLTKLANRASLFEQGEKMVVNFKAQPTELSVILFDLDHFKKINDNFGHHIGDKVLIKVAELVKETMRSRDVLSRLGGEEFVALLPFADSNKAKAIAVRIKEKIAQHDFSSFMLQCKVTVSVGVATMESDQMSFDDLVHGADLAMYQAKDQGRNTVVCYQNIATAQERRAN